MSKLNIPITTITFDQPFHPAKLKKMRGAIIESAMSFKHVFEAANVPTDVFHNHVEKILVEETEGTSDTPEVEKSSGRHFNYPLIHYQIRHKKAGITGIGEGAQALQLWLSLVENELTVGGQNFSLSVDHHRHSQWTPSLSAETTTYRINKWLAFSANNYELWKKTPQLTEKAKLLNNILWGHVSHLMNGLSIVIDKKDLVLYTSTIDFQTYKDCYGIQKLALDITFCTNLNLPCEIGLGQGTTVGFGKVQAIKRIKQ